ncbi:hypothetical protein HPB48_019226 [Haemaphysalis longicornis]|uniref:Uncharacterized protein n=1 Tax=Haemaphysalis longicornis TaxID=44386 RepID=A0A9J6GBT0_HAELO|nr:hypothetical protein HPB48_019226 [Haemaphysalis longicornis]
MPESPMWLLATKHYKDAEEVLIAAVRKNKVSGADVSAIIKRYEDKMESERSLTKPTFAALFRYRCIRKTSIIISVKSPGPFALLKSLRQLCHGTGRQKHILFITNNTRLRLRAETLFQAIRDN